MEENRVSALIESPSYKLAKIILSKKNHFTLGEIQKDVKLQGIPIESTDELSSILNRFRDNGIIIEHGSKYSLSSAIIR
jgi:hypothetical protein